jgi:hypothetical protein
MEREEDEFTEEESLTTMPSVYAFSYLRQEESHRHHHHVIHSVTIYDVASLSKAKKEQLVTFLTLNCTLEDRAHLNLSSMSKRDLLRHAVAILVPQKKEGVNGNVHCPVTLDALHQLFGREAAFIGKTKRPASA